MIQDRISEITDESDFLIKLMESSKLFDDRGQPTGTGNAQIGLHTLNYDVYMSQADQYADEVKKLNKEIANDAYDTNLISRRNELLKLQRDAILAAESEKDAVRDLVENGIDAELDSLTKLIDAYKESLSGAKDLYDYQKNVKQQTQEIASLQKQLSAYSGDNSEENWARMQKIQVDLGNAMDGLEELNYDRYISDQEKLLDDLYDEYEQILNQRLDDVDLLMEEMIASTNMNSAEIKAAIETECAAVGTTMSDAMNNIWSAGPASSIVSLYGDQMITQMTSLNAELINVNNSVLGLYGNTEAISSQVISAAGDTVDALDRLDASNKEQSQNIVNATNIYGDAINNNLMALNRALVGVTDYLNKILAGQAQNAKVEPPKAEPPKPASTQPAATKAAPKVETPKQEPQPAPAAKAATKQIKVVNGQWWLYEDAYGKKKTSSIVHSGEVYEYLGEKNNNTLIMYKGKKRYFNSKGAKKIGFAKGGYIADLQKVPYQNGDDMITINTLKKGEAVLTPEQAAQFKIVTQNLSKLNGAIDISRQLSELSKPTALSAMGGGDINVGGITIPISIESVQDYNDFVRQMRDDKTFERMIQTMVIAPMTGKSTLAKKKYYS